MTCLGALTFAATGAGAAFYTFNNNVATLAVTDLMTNRPAAPEPDPDDPNAGVPVNIQIGRAHV